MGKDSSVTTPLTPWSQKLIATSLMDALFNSFIEPKALLYNNNEEESFLKADCEQSNFAERLSPTPPEDLSVEKLYHMTLPLMEKLYCIELQMHSEYYSSRHNSAHAQRHHRPSGFANVRVLRSLDDICIPVFRKSPNPKPAELNQMAAEVLKMYPQLERKQVFSTLRKWFRKHRDENGQKVFAVCTETLVPMMNHGLTVDQIQADIKNVGPLIYSIRQKSALEITNEVEANDFVMKKIEAFLERRIDKNGNIKQM